MRQLPRAADDWRVQRCAAEYRAACRGSAPRAGAPASPPRSPSRAAQHTTSSPSLGLLGPDCRRQRRQRRRRHRHLLVGRRPLRLRPALGDALITVSPDRRPGASPRGWASVTGKGLAELVREHYGSRWSVLATSPPVANSGSASPTSSASARRSAWPASRRRSSSRSPPSGSAAHRRGSYQPAERIFIS